MLHLLGRYPAFERQARRARINRFRMAVSTRESISQMAETVRMRFDHVSIAVKSIDRALEFFARYFPITLRNEKRAEEQVSGRFFWQDFHLGGFVIELIENSPGEPGFVTRFIERRGEGLHHLSVEVDRLGPLVSKLKAGGVRVVDEQRFEDGSATAFISPRSAFGALIQFWQVPDFDVSHARELPPNRGAQFDHVSLAVHDIRAAYDFFSRYFPGAEVIHEPHVAGSSGNFALGHMQVAGRKLEFIQSPPRPAADDFVARFIARYGEGLHHITLVLSDYDATLERLRRDGVRIVGESSNWRGEREFYISPRSAFGVLIQVWSES
jgi:methylmalonyl-CoA/ethylmalonyl-CoA epimerase